LATTVSVLVTHKATSTYTKKFTHKMRNVQKAFNTADTAS